MTTATELSPAEQTGHDLNVIAEQLEQAVRLSGGRAKHERLAALYRSEARCWQRYAELSKSRLTAAAALRAADRAFSYARKHERRAADIRTATAIPSPFALPQAA